MEFTFDHLSSIVVAFSRSQSPCRAVEIVLHTEEAIEALLLHNLVPEIGGPSPIEDCLHRSAPGGGKLSTELVSSMSVCPIRRSAPTRPHIGRRG